MASRTAPASTRSAETDPTGGEIASSSVGRVIRVIEAFSEDEPELSFTELRRRLGIAPTTLQRVLSSLENPGYLVRGAGTKKYRLGLAMVERARIALNINGVVSEVGDGVAELAARTGCNANLAVLQNGLCYLLVRVPKAEFRNHKVHAGIALPPHCTALGNALLAWAPDQEVATALRRAEWNAGANSTVRNERDLERRLRLVRRDGYAIDRGEWNADVVAYASPIRDSAGKSIAAIGVSDFRAQIDAARERGLIEAVSESALAASLRRGYDPYR